MFSEAASSRDEVYPREIGEDAISRGFLIPKQNYEKETIRILRFCKAGPAVISSGVYPVGNCLS